MKPSASTSAYVAEGDHQAESGAGGNPGSQQEDTAQPAEIAEPMELDESMESLAEGEPLEITLPVNPFSSSTECTLRCDEVQSENRQLRNKVKSLQKKLLAKSGALKTAKRSRQNLMTKLQKQMPATKKTASNNALDDHDVPETSIPAEFSDNDAEVENDEKYETETETETETDCTTESDDEDNNDNHPRLTVTGTNLRTEPKHIVFLSQLLLLFKFCHICKTDNPALVVRQVGTEAVVTTTCSNPKCQGQVYMWHSQPTMPGTGIPAANFLLCMAILLAGGSASKVFQTFSHMGLGCVSLNTFFKYQRSKLFPTIYMYWKKYQSKLLEKVKAVSGGVVVAGDGRHDSMGHSAKFGAYTIFCCTVPMIIHFALIQRNQAGSSPAMEFMGFKQCMDYLLGCGVLITTFISGRHTTIASHMKKVLTKIVHYFDIWHLKKKIRKVLTKLSKEKGCEMLSEWIKPCENHLYWSASSTFSGNGLVIWAKFKTFLSHIINKHTSLTDPLFNKCGHGDIHPRKWLHAGSVAYEKLCAALTQNSLVRGIKQASPFAQTSCLEGFHSLLNQFAPKMIGYSYVGLYCRHILAVVHFNLNLQRQVKCKESDGSERVRVSYPKFKNGEATV